MVQWYSTAGASAQPHLIHVSLGPPESTTQMASQSVQPFLHSSRQTVVGHAQGDLDPHQVHGSLGPSESTSQTAFRSVQPFLHSSRHNVPILYDGPPFSPSILTLSHRGIGTPIYSTWFLGPVQAQNPKTSRSAQPFLQGSLLRQTDRHTDRQTTLLGL